MKLLRYLLLLLASYYSGQVVASDNQSAVMGLLQGYEWSLQPTKFANLDATSYKTLLEIARDEQQVNFIRSRAAVALTLYPNEEVWKFYSHEISGNKSQIQRRHQVFNLCTSFVSVDPDRVERQITPLLAEDDPHMRVRSAKCLRKIDSDSARDSLAHYRDSIISAWEMQAAGLNKSR